MNIFSCLYSCAFFWVYLDSISIVVAESLLIQGEAYARDILKSVLKYPNLEFKWPILDCSFGSFFFFSSMLSLVL